VLKTIGREELRAKLKRGDDFALVEVLGPEDYARGHIPGAINIPLERIAHEAKRRLPLEKEIVVYCASSTCKASEVAAKKLKQVGFKNVSVYVGGKRDWVEAGGPLVAGEGGGEA
jgi:rhodanese-related sulfurtransferase